MKGSIFESYDLSKDVASVNVSFTFRSDIWKVNFPQTRLPLQCFEFLTSLAFSS